MWKEGTILKNNKIGIAVIKKIFERRREAEIGVRECLFIGFFLFDGLVLGWPYGNRIQ